MSLLVEKFINNEGLRNNKVEQFFYFLKSLHNYWSDGMLKMYMMVTILAYQWGFMV